MSRLTDAMDELNKFLNENPRLKKKQEEITKLLAKTPEKNRLDVLFIMIGAKLKELNKELDEFITTTEKEIQNV